MALRIQFNFVDGNQLETIAMDATLKETYDMTAEITDFPVEGGADISDNIRKKPTGLQLDCIVADFPLKNEGRAQVSSGAPEGFSRPPAQLGRAKSVLDKLEELQAKGRPVSVQTGLGKTYPKMGIESIKLDRDKSISKGLRLAITLKTIIIATSQTVLIQKARDPIGKGKVTDGKKTGTEPTEPQKKKASLILDGFGKSAALVKNALGF